jgi:Protein of unknown function (DUF3575)
MRLLLFFLLGSFSSLAQSTQKNALKFNVLGPISKLYSIQYEHSFSDRVSFNATIFHRTKMLIPFGTTVDSLAKRHGVGITGIKFNHIFMNEAQIGLSGFSPEMRYYFGDTQNRWFLSAFAQFESFNVTVPASLAVQLRGMVVNVKSPVDFNFNTRSIGILVGKQFRWNRLGLDVVLIGPHWGKARNFDLLANNALLEQLNTAEQSFLKEKIKERFGLSEEYFSIAVEKTGAEVKSIKPIPYLGIRGLGLNLFYFF